MAEVNCENVCIAVMAIADGEKPLLQADQVEAHLVNCANCRLEIEQLRAMTALLDSQQRHEPRENIWPLIERRLNTTAPASKARLGSRSFLFLGLLLFGYKIILTLPERDPGVWFRLLPALFVIAVFIYLKENPFKINCELKLEGERYDA
ncbi:MAG: anti-sigma factor family protein [Blastocatellia bacterium]